jgi:hypothetical protein
MNFLIQKPPLALVAATLGLAAQIKKRRVADQTVVSRICALVFGATAARTSSG